MQCSAPTGPLHEETLKLSWRLAGDWLDDALRGFQGRDLEERVNRWVRDVQGMQGCLPNDTGGSGKPCDQSALGRTGPWMKR